MFYDVHGEIYGGVEYGVEAVYQQDTAGAGEGGSGWKWDVLGEWRWLIGGGVGKVMAMAFAGIKDCTIANRKGEMDIRGKGCIIIYTDVDRHFGMLGCRGMDIQNLQASITTSIRIEAAIVAITCGIF